jgi:hypothetical protein
VIALGSTAEARQLLDTRTPDEALDVGFCDVHLADGDGIDL